jgi:CIC family chloride channel protein
MAALSLLGLMIGMIASITTVGFVELVHYMNRVLYVSTGSRAQLEGTELAIVTIAVLTLGGLLVGLILRYGTVKGEAHGPPEAIYAVQLREPLPTPLSGLASTVAATLSLGCGASVGQYGPLVYLGALVGQLANRLQLGIRDVRSIAIACGVAAAISAGFNAPIAGLIFTHEVILRHYSLRMFTAVTIASACGYVVANVIFNHPPLFLFEYHSDFHASEFLLFALEGISCGFLAVLFMKLLQRATQLSKQIKIPTAFKPMLAGFLVSLVALQVPEVLGAGQEVFRLASMPGSYTADTLLLILIAKLLVTVLCIGFGFSGGVIYPSMLIGVLFGALFAILVPELILGQYSGLSVYAICGMVAVMSPVIGAPMTALLLIFELTRNYEITIAAMVTIVFANLVSFQWCGRSFYDSQLASRGMDLSLGRERAYLKHRRVTEFITQPFAVVYQDTRISELRRQLEMNPNATTSAVVTDSEGIYLGQVTHHQLGGIDENSLVSSIEFQQDTEFNESTNIWQAMETMRNFIGEAIVVVDSSSGKYLGAIPEAVVISAYLDAAQELRREEHEA